MSELPQIDQTKLIQKLTSKNAEKEFQLIQLELLAEALRDERDAARTELASVTQQLKEATS